MTCIMWVQVPPGEVYTSQHAPNILHITSVLKVEDLWFDQYWWLCQPNDLQPLMSIRVNEGGLLVEKKQSVWLSTCNTIMQQKLLGLVYSYVWFEFTYWNWLIYYSIYYHNLYTLIMEKWLNMEWDTQKELLIYTPVLTYISIISKPALINWPMSVILWLDTIIVHIIVIWSFMLAMAGFWRIHGHTSSKYPFIRNLFS